MDIDVFALEVLVRQRLAELREEARRDALAREATGPRPSLRAALGLALMRAGRALAGPRVPAPDPR